MKAKKALLPILTGALAIALGLAACGQKQNDNNQSGDNQTQQSSGEGEEVAINVTAEGDKKNFKSVKLFNYTLTLKASNGPQEPKAFSLLMLMV